MKIRIKGNSLRYRLTKTDVANLAAHGIVEESTNFKLQILKYILISKDDENLSASFEDNTITVSMPEYMILEWVNTDRVGFEHTDNGMHLLVEKDFVCLDTVEEDQSDNYPNPLLG